MGYRPLMQITLVQPPMWYFGAVPSDLAYTAGALRAAGHDVDVHDLSMGFLHHLVGASPAWATLQQWATYRDAQRHRSAAEALERTIRGLALRSGGRLRLRSLALDCDEGDAVAGRAAALDAARNPALPYLKRMVRKTLARQPELIAITLVHPDQRPQALGLAALYRRAGFEGKLVVFGALEDVVAPLDLGPDLVGSPPHALFDDFDAAVLGESESALVGLASGDPAPPNVIDRTTASLPPHELEDLRGLAPPDFSWVQPQHYPFPAPIVDLRMGRGCPWGRCAFCAIQAHQPGYRHAGAERVAQAMQTAHEQLGSSFFRVRDDLLTPSQLRALGAEVARLPFEARWSARARFEAPLTRSCMEASTGLEELWLGLESAVPRVRDAMDKGVRQDIVERVLADGKAVGLRMRALCLIGFPGETEDEVRQTLDFLSANREALAGCSLTPFQLMRRSPMVSNLPRWGVEIGRDPVPRERRLRHTLPLAHVPGVGPDRAKAIAEEYLPALVGHFMQHPGPWPSHYWLGDSVRRRGPPS